MRLARRYQGGTRFVEDDLAGDPEAGALASNQHCKRHAGAADLIGAGAAGPAAQAFPSTRA